MGFETDQLGELKQKGTYFKLRVLEDEQAPGALVRRQEGHQSGVEQLAGTDDASHLRGG